MVNSQPERFLQLEIYRVPRSVLRSDAEIVC